MSWCSLSDSRWALNSLTRSLWVLCANFLILCSNWKKRRFNFGNKFLKNHCIHVVSELPQSVFRPQSYELSYQLKQASCDYFRMPISRDQAVRKRCLCQHQQSQCSWPLIHLCVWTFSFSWYIMSQIQGVMAIGTYFFTMPPSATPPFSLREPPGRKS